MKINRVYTKQGQDPFENIQFKLTNSEIKNPDGTVLFSFKEHRSARVIFSNRY